MTPQEKKLHAVSTAIRQALPRLMEIREGCYLERKGNIYKIVNERYHSTLLSQDSHHIYFAISPNYHQKPDFLEINEIYLDEYEILGHDILLNDVLEWLGDRFGHLYSTDSNGNLYEETDFSKVKVAHINLSKPRLADQSEKLWAFLYNLIKNN